MRWTECGGQQVAVGWWCLRKSTPPLPPAPPAEALHCRFPNSPPSAIPAPPASDIPVAEAGTSRSAAYSFIYPTSATHDRCSRPVASSFIYPTSAVLPPVSPLMKSLRQGCGGERGSYSGYSRELHIQDAPRSMMSGDIGRSNFGSDEDADL
ncbi:DEA(D/H)-box RNA helicase family protein [Striga asiatica]|uniref:DEA(D/H)-box RNA helicase family protein n=1 Tax=Striga asiatica TaxID=4170 RepID=A0A5A7QHF3_STRAF|nr:DEA(D/H)-box RNA helicase family protein [Striga asiatica]